MKLEARSVGWATGARRIVQDVSFEVTPGETFGLIGPNGSGKSTLLRLLAGLLARPSGAVLLDGEPLTSLSRRDIAQNIAVVEQIAETSEALSVRDVVELGRTPWLSALRPFGAQDRVIVNDALEAVGMAHMTQHRWATLSGGERQRVQIARALAQRPRLLMLDEPTNHLDIHHQLSLLRLVGNLPVTVIIALHDLNQAMGCDRLAVMDEGRMVACGPPGEVLDAARLASIFRVKATRLRDPADNATIFRFQCPGE
ncbi:ABC transporter ATP-binding protein [Pseudosulfitobacter pseudonitzschiae]|uniref:Histidinol phosphatase n=1 Tax=Pseudosulfitobacter pseudonitzschiae TaxID=1402135 RepID=A0A073J067_9RHOB|nr:ABC transporter ATP-binding protein [Pseudosulfitobacter pseudonitzschiae]KEJ95270.1 histidinol phosphatase [Pseudosulfitobacter pseudonitzschiae]MBM1816697.1 ABC transporter ATP-binding protein [Pseudosulfitobacter pseudonitzschiae]MBM1833507.1 ABC transporter ATP-binding protein [Pseudosulfitobacter pseudonitzschiae]MBM1838374.1 ABC transporter ATP-binding protein [Pseudosulfitobacter pseudonitzschiae]MBM1843424.1 ABC transporter ATP-binding protein [Pseudosulfitobacter pseudonitzschiae]